MVVSPARLHIVYIENVVLEVFQIVSIVLNARSNDFALNSEVATERCEAISELVLDHGLKIVPVLLRVFHQSQITTT